MSADQKDSSVAQLAEACAKGDDAARMELERRAEAYGVARDAMWDLVLVYKDEGDLDPCVKRVATALGLWRQEES